MPKLVIDVSYPFLIAILKTPTGSMYAAHAATGEAEGLPLDDTASGSGQEREALQSMEENDTAILLSGTKHVQLARNPTPPKEKSAAACGPLNTERTAPNKGVQTGSKHFNLVQWTLHSSVQL